MTVFAAVLYGLLQGITEFLPVSSSGHLSLAQNFFGADGFKGSYLAFVVFLHLGTLAAVVAVYHKDVFDMVKGFFTLAAKLFTGRLKNNLNRGEKLFLLTFVATLPLVIAVPFADKVEFLSSVSWAVGILLIINGAILYAADKLTRGNINLESAAIPRALIVGLIQLAAIVPGISRSGSTITGGRIAGIEKNDAVKFSFLMSIPAIAGANIFELIKIKDYPLPAGSAAAVVCGVLAAVASGLFAIKLLSYMAKKDRLSAFSLYCAVIGATAVIADIFI